MYRKVRFGEVNDLTWSLSLPCRLGDWSPGRLSNRLYEKATSAALSGVPSENLTSLRSLKVNVFASGEVVYDSATSGCGLVVSPGLKVSSVSYTAWKNGSASKSTPPRSGSVS